MNAFCALCGSKLVRQPNPRLTGYDTYDGRQLFAVTYACPLWKPWHDWRPIQMYLAFLGGRHSARTVTESRDKP